MQLVRLTKSIYFVCLLIVQTVLGCNSNHQPKNNSERDFISDTVTLDEPAMSRVDYEKTKALKSVFIIDRNGASYSEQPNDSAKVLGKFLTVQM